MCIVRKYVSIVITILLLMVMLVPSAIAEVDWSAMSDEEIRSEIQAGQKELMSRDSNEFKIGEPVIIRNKYGSYYFTLVGAHTTETDSYLKKDKGEDAVVVCVQAVCENIDCNTYSNNYISNYYIQSEDIRVADQERFSLEILDYTGVDDGRYEVCAHTSAGEKRRISLTYFAYSDTTSIIVSIPGYGSVEIPLI